MNCTCPRIDGYRIKRNTCPVHAENDAATMRHGYGVDSDCVCGRNFSTVRGLREHLAKQRRAQPTEPEAVRWDK